ncbi:MAG: MFS transporter [Pseudomonadota bacterium]
MSGITDQNRKWWILISMAACAGLIMLDETVVGVALPTLQRDLGMSRLASHWVISIYMLVFAAAAAASGRIGDRIGFSILLPVGAGLFGVGSLACGFATNGALLITARAVQGLGAAIIFPSTVAMIMIVFPKEQRGTAMGTLAAIGTVFLALGPLIGGVLTELVTWRWIFWINIPIVAIAAVIALVALPRDSEDKKSESFDTSGLVTMVGGLTLLVFAVMQGPAMGWTSWFIVGSFCGGVILLVVFVVLESRFAEPLINVELFRQASFSSCSLILFTGQFAKISLVVFGAMYLQQKIGMSPFTAGLALLVAVVAFPFLSLPVGRMADKLGARSLVLSGQGIATVAMFWIMLSTGWDRYWVIMPGLLIWGIGMSFIYAPVLRALANSVPKEKQGQVGGIGVTFRLLGGTVSAAVGSTLLLTTDSFQIVFLVTGLLMLLAWAFGWFAILHEPTKPDAQVHHPMRIWGHS